MSHLTPTARWSRFPALLALAPLLLAALVLLPAAAGCAPSGPVWELGALDSEGRLVLADTAGHSRPLTSQGGVIDFSWSPDGRLASYVRLVGRDEGREAHVMDVAAGSDTLRPELSARDLCSLDWSPDGSRLAVDYGTACGGRTLVVVDPAPGREEARLFYGVRWAWSPDGQAIAFARPEPDVPVPAVESGYSFSLALWQAGGAEPVTLLAGTSERGFAPHCWPAQGPLVVTVMDFAGTAGGPQYLALPDPGSGAAPASLDRPPPPCDRELIQGRMPAELRGSATGAYSWSPDGLCLAFAAGQHPDTWVYLLDWQRGTVRRLVPGTAPQFRPPGPR